MAARSPAFWQATVMQAASDILRKATLSFLPANSSFKEAEGRQSGPGERPGRKAQQSRKPGSWPGWHAFWRTFGVRRLGRRCRTPATPQGGSASALPPSFCRQPRGLRGCCGRARVRRTRPLCGRAAPDTWGACAASEKRSRGDAKCDRWRSRILDTTCESPTARWTEDVT